MVRILFFFYLHQWHEKPWTNTASPHSAAVWPPSPVANFISPSSELSCNDISALEARQISSFFFFFWPWLLLLRHLDLQYLIQVMQRHSSWWSSSHCACFTKNCCSCLQWYCKTADLMPVMIDRQSICLCVVDTPSSDLFALSVCSRCASRVFGFTESTVSSTMLLFFSHWTFNRQQKPTGCSPTHQHALVCSDVCFWDRDAVWKLWGDEG